MPEYHGWTHGPHGTDPAPPSSPPKLEPFNVPGALSTFTGASKQDCLEDGEIDYVFVGLGTAPTGSGVTVRLNKNGSSLGTVTIAAGSRTNSFTPSPATFVAGDYFSFDVTAIGSTTPGTDLLVQFRLA